MLAEITAILKQTAALVWGDWLVWLLVATGVFLTFRLRFTQVRHFAHTLRVLTGKYDRERSPGEISHFQALATALSATLGLGNIAGVALAIGMGGPGALFWMWLTGILGMATKAASCTLAVRYRHFTPDGKVLGGPMHYIEMGLGKKFRGLAILFALLVTLASFGGGNMFQANQVAAALWESFHIPKIFSGLFMAGAVAVVIIGGIKRIGRVAGKLVPLMTFVYVGGAVTVIVLHLDQLPAVFGLIFRDAFSGQAAAGGLMGEVIRSGIQRGTFSNEAGIGSAPIAHAAAHTDEPAREGLVAALGPFIDTLVVATLTGLVILFSGNHLPVATPLKLEGQKIILQSKQPGKLVTGDKLIVGQRRSPAGSITITEVDPATGQATGDWKSTDAKETTLPEKALLKKPVYFGSGVRLTASAFDSILTGFGTWFVSLAVVFFAFSTMLSWSYYGEEGIQYLAGARAVTPYRLVFVTMVFTGSVWHIGPVLNFTDTAFGLMAVPNLIALWLLSGQVRALHQDYDRRMKKLK